MKHVPVLFCLALAGHSHSLRAQPYYQRSFGGFVNEDAYTILGTPDNGLIVGGSSGSFVAGTNADDIYLTKFDREGNLIWTKHYNGGIVSWALDMASTSDLGTVVVGSLNNAQGVLFKVDASGEAVWAQVAALDEYSSVSVTPDDTVFAVGYSLISNSDLQLDKFDGNGVLIWTKRFGTSYADEAYGVTATSDGGAIIAGSTLVGGPETDGLLVKVDASGGLEWSRTYGSDPGYQRFNAVCLAGDGYLAVGDDLYSNYGRLIVRTDEAGDTLWTRRFPGEGHFRAVEAVPEGFLISGDGEGAYSSPGVFLLSDDGELLWRSAFSSTMFMAGAEASHASLADGSVALVCTAANEGPGARDCWIAVMDEQGGGVACHLDTTLLQPVPAIWQLADLGEDLGAGSVNGSGIGSYQAATLLETLCGDVSVQERIATTPTIRYDALAGVISVRGAMPGQSLSVYDVLGSPLRSWSLQGSTVEVPLGTVSSAPLLATVRDELGRAMATIKFVVTPRP